MAGLAFFGSEQSFEQAGAEQEVTNEHGHDADGRDDERALHVFGDVGFAVVAAAEGVAEVGLVERCEGEQGVDQAVKDQGGADDGEDEAERPAGAL